MRRPLRIVLAALLMLAALYSLALASQTAVLTYYLEPLEDGGDMQQRTQVFPPGVIATVVSGFTVLATAVWLVVVSLRARAKLWWFVVSALVVVSLAVLMITSGVRQPDF